MAADAEIWDYAEKHGMAIVTMDDDFVEMAIRHDRIPPQVIWVRLGNIRKLVLIRAFTDLLPMLKESLSQGHSVVEIR